MHPPSPPPVAVRHRSQNPTLKPYFRLRPPNAPSPEVPPPLSTELGLQAAPQRSKLITYTARDRKRYSKKTASTNDAAAADVVSVTSHRPRKVYPPKSRRSGRLRSGRMGDSSPSSMNLQQAIQWGILLLAPSNNQILPIVDRLQRIIGVHAAAPQGQESYWAQCVVRATKGMGRLHRNGESLLRVGMEFGYRGPYPHPFDHTPVNAHELGALVDSEEFKFIAAYQNHLLRQFAPRRHAHQIIQVEQLQIMPVPQLNDNNHLAPAFAGSPFTTTQFNLGNGMNIMKRDAYDDFGSLRAEEGDRFALCCPPGTTLLIPASTVRYAFSEIRQGETRYLFQQYFNAALGRWVEHGGYVGCGLRGWAFCGPGPA
ncbi:hypothetical protein B0H14DRAFT_3509189 [Mycena olivaceomarginata]|nr:hypothetical protein B0H14DRAFT_3509189 [Mycena olivaceomarginata]